jgi:hypothetical protein
MLLRRPFRIEAGDFHKLWLGAPARDGADTECLVADAPALIQTFFARRVALRVGQIALSNSHRRGARRLRRPAGRARRIGRAASAELREVPGGHWLIGEQAARRPSGKFTAGSCKKSAARFCSSRRRTRRRNDALTGESVRSPRGLKFGARAGSSACAPRRYPPRIDFCINL